MQQIYHSTISTFNNISRNHRIMLSALIIISLFAIFFKSEIHHNDNINPIFKYFLYNIKKSNLNQQSLQNYNKKYSFKNKIKIYKYIIMHGDTLTSILNKYNVNLKYIKILINSDKNFRMIKPGQKISLKFNNKKELKNLVWNISNHEERIYTLINKKFFLVKINFQKVIWKNFVIKGTINRNFIYSIQSVGLHINEINRIVNSMRNQLNFNKLHYGDQFSILILRSMLKEKYLNNKILGIKLKSNGKNYFAFRANNGKFYDKYGLSLKQNFMRLPTVKHFRISSAFNLHRLNPITGIISPHKGVDFALPIGTPVLSIGNGKIIVAKYGGSAGNYISILHNHNYITRYMHLKKILVKKGQIVKKGECIAFSGNTGRSTGPHLHFEIWINNKAVNPLTAKLPYMKSLIGKERNKYLSQVKIFMKQLIS